MGLFTKKKKVAGSTAGHTPAAQSTSSFPSPPTTPVALSPLAPRLSLRVAVDPSPVGVEALFYIFVNPHDDISAIRIAIAEKLGNVSLGLFKVSIPWQAYYQAQAYTERYRIPVDLLSSFPSFNLDDADQLGQSLGPSAWGKDLPSSTRIADWWPESTAGDQISVIARVVPTSSSSVVPLTFLTHITDAESAAGTRSAGSSPPSGKPSRLLPTAIDISRSQPVSALKEAILERHGMKTGSLEDVVIWRVEMSEDEMIVIEERGGLKGGKMPWPYPPTAPVPVMLDNPSLPISHYFDATHRSNPRIITLSVWINTSSSSSTRSSSSTTTTTTDQTSEHIPRFRYPMVLDSPSIPPTMKSPPPTPAHQASPTLTTPSGSSSRTASPHSNTFGSSSSPCSGKRTRQRPSTAPAVVVTGTGSPTGSPQIHAFGARSIRATRASPNIDTRPRITSPLTTGSITASTTRGLGITSRLESPRPDGAARPSICSFTSSDDEANVPYLTMSQLSLAPETSSERGLVTPVEVKTEWLAEPLIDEMGRLKKSSSLRSPGMWRRGGKGDIGKAVTLNAQILR